MEYKVGEIKGATKSATLEELMRCNRKQSGDQERADSDPRNYL